MIDKKQYLTNDCKFNELFPREIQKFASKHWTPFEIIDLVVDFLAEDSCKILDIGSGIGKFCLAGAYYAPHAQFFGIEQRHNLVDYATTAQQKLGIPNAAFIKGNFTQFDLKEFNHFYFFNSFFENLDGVKPLDETIELSPALFDYYNQYLYTELKKMPAGTKIATYHSILNKIPRTYELVESYEYAHLNFWIKR